MSCVSTTVPTCTDRTEVAPKITPSVRACDTKRVRAQHFIRRRAAGGSPAALLCVSSEVSHCAGQVVLEGLARRSGSCRPRRVQLPPVTSRPVPGRLLISSTLSPQRNLTMRAESVPRGRATTVVPCSCRSLTASSSTGPSESRFSSLRALCSWTRRRRRSWIFGVARTARVLLTLVPSEVARIKRGDEEVVTGPSRRSPREVGQAAFIRSPMVPMPIATK